MSVLKKHNPLTDAEARNLLSRVYAEVQRRDTLAQAPAQAAALASAALLLLTATGALR